MRLRSSTGVRVRVASRTTSPVWRWRHTSRVRSASPKATRGATGGACPAPGRWVHALSPPCPGVGGWCLLPRRCRAMKQTSGPMPARERLIRCGSAHRLVASMTTGAVLERRAALLPGRKFSGGGGHIHGAAATGQRPAAAPCSGPPTPARLQGLGRLQRNGARRVQRGQVLQPLGRCHFGVAHVQ